jgi:hypothetical protein
MKPAIALAATARSFVGRRDIDRLVRRIDSLAGPTRWLPGFAVVVFVWQAALLLALLGGVIQLGVYAGIHFFGCFAVMAFLVWRLNVSAPDDRYSAALQIVGWSALAGPFGAFVAAAISLPSPVRAGTLQGHAVDDAKADLVAIGHAERTHIALLDRRIRIEGASRICPLMDVIAEGSQAAKLEALGVVYRRYETRLSAVLKSALKDPDASVRVLAATVTAKIHARYAEKSGDCQAAAAAEPERARNWRDLAEARLAYAESGLLEVSRAQAQIELAIGDLSRATELDPTDSDSADRLDMARQRLSARGTKLTSVTLSAERLGEAGSP